MDKHCPSSIGNCSDEYDHSQIRCLTENQERCSLKEISSEYMCNICNRFFSKEKYLNEHIKIHVENNLYVCNICSNNSFDEQGDLKNHLLTHSRKKRHICIVCNKSFTHKKTWKIHLLTHTEPHLCNICNESFTDKIKLQCHLLKHLGVKPHKCDICNKSFTLKRTLKDHVLIHSREKPYVCDICMKSFISEQNLNKHIILCRKRYKKNFSFDKQEEFSSTSEKSRDVNSDSHLDETNENSHEDNYPGEAQVKEEIDYIVKEEHDISDEENCYPNVDEMLIKSYIDSHDIYCDVKEEDIQNELNDFVKEEHNIDYEDLAY